MGTIYRREHVLWIQYFRNGKRYRETTGCENKTDAKRLLRPREGDIERGTAVTLRVGRVTVDQATTDLRNDYVVNGCRSIGDAQCRIDPHLDPVSVGRRMAGIVMT
jgi:hypothetical protein